MQDNFNSSQCKSRIKPSFGTLIGDIPAPKGLYACDPPRRPAGDIEDVRAISGAGKILRIRDPAIMGRPDTISRAQRERSER